MAARHIVALLTPPVSLFDVGYVTEVFDLLRRQTGSGRYSVAFASSTPSPLAIDGSPLLLDGIGSASESPPADTLIVVGYPTEGPADPRDVEVVQECFARGARILSICTGAFLLAGAGLLDGRRATTHWAYAEPFRTRFPDVKLDPDILYADEGQIMTSAGSAAGLDMLLDFIRAEEGSTVTNAIARRLNVSPHRDGGQAQFIPRPVPDIADDRINRLIQWMRANCTQPVNIKQLASRVAMSPRNFYRHFRSVTGHTPYNWLLRERIGIAMQLLEGGGLTLERIADASGFASTDALRTHFQRVIGISPTSYRQMFACRTSADEAGADHAPAVPELRRVA